jgi:Fur family peroxide stress response transcriptional regulator
MFLKAQIGVTMATGSAKSTKEISIYLKDHNIRPSLIRVKVLQYLMENRNHPTADSLYKEIMNDIPTLSKTSIYNALNTLIKSGLINEVTIEDNLVRYDSNVDRHGHFKCLNCGKVYDFEMKCKACQARELEGFSVVQELIYLKGICALCQKKRGKVK